MCSSVKRMSRYVPRAAYKKLQKSEREKTNTETESHPKRSICYDSAWHSTGNESSIGLKAAYATLYFCVPDVSATAYYVALPPGTSSLSR